MNMPGRTAKQCNIEKPSVAAFCGKVISPVAILTRDKIMTQTRDSRPSDAEFMRTAVESEADVLKDIRELLKQILKEVSHRNAT
jgi:hypothetical protein